MAAVLQTALKNTILSAYQSASNIPTEPIHLANMKSTIALISYSERLLGLTPVNATANPVVRTESEIITQLESAKSQLQTSEQDFPKFSVAKSERCFSVLKHFSQQY